MSTKADALLNSMTGGNAELGDAVLGQMLLGVSDYGNGGEDHIIIDRNRFITVPEALKRIAVEDDHRIETVTFDCPRYWDEHDLSEMKIYINYIRYDKYIGSYPIDNAVTIDEDDDSIIHFDWVITREVTDVAGGLVFLVCAKKVDENGNEENHWNSELNKDLYVSEGLEVHDIIMNEYPDLITYLLTRMDVCEHKTTLEAMLGYLDEYFATDATINDVLLNYVEGFLANDPGTKNTIASVVNDYISGKLSVTDKTLTIDGGVADAKATGDAINTLTGAVNNRLPLSGGTMSAPIVIDTSSGNLNAAIRLLSNERHISIASDSTDGGGQAGIWDYGDNNWILQSDSDGNVKIPHNTYVNNSKVITQDAFTVSGDTLIINFL